MKKFTIYLGLNDKDTKAQKIATVEAYKIVSNLIVKHFDGGTIFEANGIYRHADGSFTVEKTLRIEIMFAERADIERFVETLKEVFNQESIAVQDETVCSELL